MEATSRNGCYGEEDSRLISNRVGYAFMPSVADRLFESHRDIRSVMLLDSVGNVLDMKSRTKRPVSRDFVIRLGSMWATLIGSMTEKMQETYGKSEYIHLDFEKLHMCSFRHKDVQVVFTARPTLSPNEIGKIIAQLRPGS